MTMFARLPAHLRRLFDRIDAEAETPALRDALSIWRHHRGSRLFPSLESLLAGELADIATDLFVFKAHRADVDKWQLYRIGNHCTALLRPAHERSALDELGDRRLAVALQRLFEFMISLGEPVAATFSTGSGQDCAVYELLAAPLASDGKSIDSVLGGVSQLSNRNDS